MHAGVRGTAAGLLVAVLVAAASPLRADDRDARRAFDAGRFDEARHLWLPLAAAGDAEAALDLGLLYDLGRGVPQDSSMAYRWYRQAAEAGLAQAAFNVAVMLDSGAGVPRDGAEAALWYARAAAGGYHRAQYALAQLYAAGDGVPRNLATAEAWYRAAAAAALAPLPPACQRCRDSGRAAASPPPGDLSPVRPVPVAPADVVLPAGQHPFESRVGMEYAGAAGPSQILRRGQGARCVRLARGCRELRRNLRDPRRAAGHAAALRMARLCGGEAGGALCQQRLELVLDRQGQRGLTPCRSRRRARWRQSLLGARGIRIEPGAPCSMPALQTDLVLLRVETTHSGSFTKQANLDDASIRRWPLVFVSDSVRQTPLPRWQ